MTALLLLQLLFAEERSTDEGSPREVLSLCLALRLVLTIMRLLDLERRKERDDSGLLFTESGKETGC